PRSLQGPFFIAERRQKVPGLVFAPQRSAFEDLLKVSTCKFQPALEHRTRLVVGVGKSLRDYGRVEYAGIFPSARANHAIRFFDLAGVNVVHLRSPMSLTDPLRRAVVLDCLLQRRTHLSNSQSSIPFTD